MPEPTVSPALAPRPVPERRASVRFFFSSDPARQPTASVTENRWTARVRDISATGIGLVCGRSFDAGRLLRVEIQAAEQTAAFMVCVVRALKQPDGDWLVGGAFTEKLSAEQLQTLTGK